MPRALIYSSALAYEAAMFAVYGRHYWSRYRAIADLIHSRSTVLDLCCGPGILYRRYLRKKSISYTGFDINSGFVNGLNRYGARAEVRDLREDVPLPMADYVVMQASLYHFLPNPEPVLNRMKAAARRALINAEPIRNLSDSRFGLVRSLAAFLTDSGYGAQAARFNEQSLDRVLTRLELGPSNCFVIDGGREKIYAFERR